MALLLLGLGAGSATGAGTSSGTDGPTERHASPQPAEGSWAEVRDQRLWYRMTGTGPNLLLLHGGLGSSEGFGKILPGLSKRFRVITVDRVGHGRSSDAGEPFVYASMAEDVKAFLDVVGVSSTAVLGWSDGGVVGYHLASRYPGLVTRLVAIGANSRPEGMSVPTLKWLAERPTPESLLADLPQVAADYRRLSPDPERLVDFVRRSRELWLRDPYITPEELRRIEAPVLLVAGDTNDIRVEHLLELRATIGHTQLCILPGASHFLVEEKPDRLLPIVTDFLVAGQAPLAGPAEGEPPPGGAGAPPPRSVTLPFSMDHNRMIVDVELVRADGTIRKARAWVDTGNPDLFLGEPLARDLGLEFVPPEPATSRIPQAPANRTPQMRLDGLPLDLAGVKTQVLVGARSMPGVPAEANLPASALRHDHVVFDYPNRKLTVARPGTRKPRGTPLPCRVNADTGLFQIEASADGRTVSLAVDNGSSYTWVSDALTTAWEARHPDWPRSRGAVGAANFFGFPFEASGTLMRLPKLGIGTLDAHAVGLLGLPQGFFDWYSGKAAGPVVGFIGANVLRGFRLEVDYPNRMTYWEAGTPPEAADLDTVGLTLRPETNGGFVVAGVATKEGRPAVEGVLPGDRFVRVGTRETAGLTMGTVADALRGTPGSRRVLVVERQGKRVTVEAEVLRFP